MKPFLFLFTFYLLMAHPGNLIAQDTPSQLNYFVTVDMEGYSRDYLFARTNDWMKGAHFIKEKTLFEAVRIESYGKFVLQWDVRGRLPKGEIHFNLDFTAYQGAYKCVITNMTFHGKFVESLEKESSEFLADKSWKLLRKQSDETIRRMLTEIRDHIENLPVYELEPVSIDDKHMDINAWKPVIYLYPEKETEVSVQLEFAGELTFTYPKYENGWTVTAQPDGSLRSENGREYGYLFWEGPFANNDWDLSEGFCVAGENAVSFFEEKLSEMGLNDSEMNDFITYWGPKLQANAWNLVHFSGQQYADRAQLIIDPKPDVLLRVFMLFTALDAPIQTHEQVLPRVKREGFTVVEWGGAELPPAKL